MNDAEQYQLARYWLDRGECPGCGAPLAKVAGQGTGHYLPGVSLRAPAGPWTTGRGEPFGTPGSMARDDPRICRWSADELAALVHIGSGVVASAGVSPVGSSV